jgi:hypothetical protein
VHVALAGDRGRVAELARGTLDRPRDVALGLPRRLEGGDLLQRERGQHRARPRAEVLRGELLARDLLQVGVDVGGVDRLSHAVLGDVLEQLVARQLLAAANDACQPLIANADLVLLAALAREAKPQLRAVDVHVPRAHGREPERAVGPRILLVADTDQRRLQQPHDGGQDLFAR